MGSRSGTPDVPSSRATPPQLGKAELASPSSKLGFKRKVEDNTDGRPDGSPPLKKLILASA